MSQTSKSFCVLQFLGKNASIQRCGGGCLRSSNAYQEAVRKNVNNNKVRLLRTSPFVISDNMVIAQQSNLKLNEKPRRKYDLHGFQADTRLLLDILARSLYSEKEVCVRELISNASDALENFRYLVNSNAEQAGDLVYLNRPLKIQVSVDKCAKQLIIQDTGIGMTHTELIKNLGTIASSGSKRFMENIKETDSTGVENPNIIGQFGVGFYSVFMLANKIEVFTRSSMKNSKGYRWYTNGLDHYEIEEVDGVDHGTKIVLHLKPECYEYSDENRIKDIIKKYSGFVRAPIYLNKILINDRYPLWLLNPNDVLVSQYIEFYRYLTHTSEPPIYTFHFKTDIPLSIRALIYFPKTTCFIPNDKRDGDIDVALYTNKVLMQSKTKNLLPKWLRFVKGVVDSEDIPTNLSRELLQNSSAIQKIRDNITRRIIRFLQDCAQRDPVKYLKFFNSYGMFLKEGIISNNDHVEKEDIAKLLRFDCSKYNGRTYNTSLEDYCNMIGEKNKHIYYLMASNRVLAEMSPYYDNYRKWNIPVLFCYNPYDELVLLQLRKFNNKQLVSVEKSLNENENPTRNKIDFDASALKEQEVERLTKWLNTTLMGKVVSVKATTRLESHPCVITVKDIAAARQFIRAQCNKNISELNRLALLQTTLEINPKHVIIKKLSQLIEKDETLAKLITEQLLTNSLIAAGLTGDPRILLNTLNNLLVRFLERH